MEPLFTDIQNIHFNSKHPLERCHPLQSFILFLERNCKEKCPCFVVFSFVDNQNDKNS